MGKLVGYTKGVYPLVIYILVKFRVRDSEK